MAKYTSKFFQPGRSYLLTSFIGVMDIKIGVTIVTLFALLNKVAGVYGVLAVFTGGTFAQVSMYLYSIATIAALIWGMKAVGEERPKSTMLFSHLFLVDHLISTFYTVFFFVVWYIYTPHDGRRVANSEAQKELMNNADSMGIVPGPGVGLPRTEEERKAAAEDIWRQERGFAAGVIIAGWVLKIYFIFLIYSYAIHLRKGSYHSLPLSRPPPPPSTYIRLNHSSSNPSSRSQYAYSHLRNTSLSTVEGNELVWEREDLEDAVDDEGESKIGGGSMKGTFEGDVEEGRERLEKVAAVIGGAGGAGDLEADRSGITTTTGRMERSLSGRREASGSSGRV